MSTVQPTYELGPAPGYAVATPDAAASPAGGGTGDAIRIIKQRKVLIIVTFILLYLLVIAGTLAIQYFAPSYQSEAFLELEAPRKSMDVDADLPLPEQMKQLLQTEARKIKQLSLLLEVLSQPDIKQTEFYKWYEPDVAKAAFELSRMLSSTPIPDTSLIRVSLGTKYKKESKDIVNAIINRYREFYVDQTRGELFDRVESLKNTLAAGQQRLKEKRDEIARFRESTEVPTSEDRRGVSSEELVELTKTANELDVVITSLQAELDSIRNIPLNELPITPEMRLLIESDPVLRYYRTTVEALDVQMRVMGTMLGTAHRQMKLIVEQRQAWFEKEVGRREELVRDIRERQIETTRQQLAQYKAMHIRVLAKMADASATQRDLDRNLQRYKEMLRDEELLLQELALLQVEVSKAEHMYNDKSRDQRLSVSQYAEEAIRPARPDYPLYLGGGFVLALAGAIGLAFLREFTDKAVRTPIDVARHGQLSVLGNIPLIDDEEADIDSIEQAARKAPQSLVAEAFRQVRTNLLFSGPMESQRTILITSPGPGDGKTAIAINLATTLAQSNQRVLLIDCNFRRPAIREAFANTRREGLSNALIGQATLEALITPTDIPNVDVLTSGPMPPNPAELLGSSYMQDLLADAKGRYDRVILDGPPALLISDAMVLAGLVDGVIIVARAVSNTKGALRRTREQLERINAHIIGAVLNGVQARAGGYFKRQYREFYEYASDETIPAELPQPGDKDGKDS